VAKNLKANGFWAVDIKEAGTYEITLRSRPHYVKDPPPLNADWAKVYVVYDQPRPVLSKPNATVEEFPGGHDASKTISRNEKSATLVLQLVKGMAKLEATLSGGPHGEHGAYFVDVKRLGK
jgi:hypothetical protein